MLWKSLLNILYYWSNKDMSPFATTFLITLITLINRNPFGTRGNFCWHWRRLLTYSTMLNHIELQFHFWGITICPIPRKLQPEKDWAISFTKMYTNSFSELTQKITEICYLQSWIWCHLIIQIFIYHWEVSTHLSIWC